MDIKTGLLFCGVGLAAVLLICVYGLKLAEIWANRQKFKDQKAEFMADIYLLQQKWARKGCTEYTDALNYVVTAFNLPEEVPQAKTEYGKSVQNALKMRQQ